MSLLTFRPTCAALAALGFVAVLAAAPATNSASPGGSPPTSWIDPDTGHRVVRLTHEPGSLSFYFNVNPFTPDGKEMAYTTRNGISVLNLATGAARQVVEGRCFPVQVGRATPTVYYVRFAEDRSHGELWATNMDTGMTRKIADLPHRASVAAINADETLAAGTFIEGKAFAPGAYGGRPTEGREKGRSNDGIQPFNKGEMMAQRLAAKLPMSLFTVDLRTGKITILIDHDTNWLNHLQFSPTIPNLLLYCHEGIWQHTDRVWVIRTDGSGNLLVHKRTLQMEIAGHEWWDADGITVRYQLYFPRDEPYGSMLASYEVSNGLRVWLHLEPGVSAIHCNSSPDDSLFCGDGDNRFPWISLLTPVYVKDDGTIGDNLIRGGYLKTEKLVNMAKHNYRLEPNPIFTPDQKRIIFRSNMFGDSYVFAVDVTKP